MPKRPITALAAALALLVAAPTAAHAQTPTPTADHAEAEPPEGASKGVKKIYDDYSDDGKIEVCDHTRDDLKDALDTIEDDVDTDFPDFREAVEAGIQRHDNRRCDDATPTPTATASPTDSSTPEAGALPTPDDNSSNDHGGGAIQPEDGSLPPEGGATPEGAIPTPPAATPTAVPPAAAAVPSASPTPIVVTSSNSDGLLIPGILLGLALLCAAALAVFAIGARRSPRLQHAWREAGLRTRGTWADFSDWLRLGR
jgi:hypothetical protein